MSQNQLDALHRLRTIILQGDEKRLQQLEEQLELLREKTDDADELLEKLDQVLVEALSHKAHDSKAEVADALAPVIGDAIKHHIEDAKEDMVDALYPVIGSTIRRSISEAMKNLIRSVNERIDKALSFQLLFRKIQARVSGVSEAELLLRDSIPFNVHEIFLIHKETGLLLCHVSVEKSANVNQELISGMLTAIRDFARTAFTNNEHGELSHIQYEELDIHLEDGKHAYLAVVTSGVAPTAFPDLLKRTEQATHKRFAKSLRSFDGDTSPYQDAPCVLRKLFSTAKNGHESTAAGASVTPWKSLLLLAAVAALVFSLIWHFRSEPWRETAPNAAETMANRSQVVKEITEHLSARFSFDTANIKYVWDGGVLILTGQVPNEVDRLAVARSVVEHSSIPMVVNNLTYEKAEHDMPAAVRGQIENTVLTFERNETRLNTTEISRLRALIPLIQAYPETEIYLNGYGDTQGNEAANLKISKLRAENAGSLLIDSGVDSTRIIILGWGTRMPQRGNVRNGNRRRVEFSIKARQ